MRKPGKATDKNGNQFTVHHLTPADMDSARWALIRPWLRERPELDEPTIRLIVDEATDPEWIAQSKEESARILAELNAKVREALVRYRDRGTVEVGRYLDGTPHRVRFAPQFADPQFLNGLPRRRPGGGKTNAEIAREAARFWATFTDGEGDRGDAG